jgi:uncharacterized protein (TIGR03437 family)
MFVGRRLAPMKGNAFGSAVRLLLTGLLAAWAAGAASLRFEENLGQTDSRVQFLARNHGSTLFLTSTEAVLALRRPGGASVLRMKLAGANPRSRAMGVDPLPGTSNYFLGSDPLRWRTKIPNYARVRYENVYPGIDLVYYGDDRQLEYDLIVAPGADPATIRLVFEGARRTRITAGGDLALEMDTGDVLERRPAVYQQAAGRRRPIACRYVLKRGREANFAVGTYDRSRPLVIDPLLRYATYLGGSAEETAAGIAVDASGSAYVAGTTSSVDFPAAGGVQPAAGGGKDVFVTKLAAGGSGIVYSTYLGGSLDDVGAGIAVDSAGNAYLTGNTLSANFPTTPGAYQPTSGGPAAGAYGDAFVARLDATGAKLLYSTYLGGGGDDAGFAIAVDAAGNAYVTGVTFSVNFPIAAGAFRKYLSGAADAFVARLNPAGSLSYSTYLGGNDVDQGFGIAVDSLGSAYITGSTTSTNFPAVNPLQPGCTGSTTPFGASCADAFITKLNAAGSAPVYSTYFGGSATDAGRAIAVDSAGNAYIAGITNSIDLRTAGAYQNNFGGGAQDAFVLKLNPSGSALLYSTYLGGNGDDAAYGIAVDAAGTAYVAGSTTSTNFPSLSPVQAACNMTGGAACADAFVARLNAAGFGLIYATYLGGRGTDRALAVAVDPSGSAYVAGETRSVDFPASPGAFQTAPGGSRDAFVAKIGEANPAPSLSLLSPASATAGSPGFTLTVFGSNFAPGAVVRWNGGDRPTAFVSTTQLTASIPGSDLAAAGPAQVTVANPPPGGGVSSALLFTVNPLPAPAISSLIPGGATLGGPDFLLTVNGSGFVAASVVRWNGAGRPTAFLSGTQVQASIPASDLAAAGFAQITVFNPAPGGGVSNSAAFLISNPVPVITSLDPASMPAGGTGFTLTVSGSGFVSNSIVRWNGTARPTTFVSSTRLQATIVAADIAASGAAQVTVFNPNPGGGSSSVAAFTIAPAPVFSSGGVVNAASFSAQPPAPGTIAAIFGSNLASASVQASTLPLPASLGGVTVRMNGSAVPLFYVSPLQINFLVPFELQGQPQALLAVEAAGVSSAAQPVNLAAFGPALFAANRQGSGQGAILVAGAGVLAAPGGAFSGSRPVNRGEFLEIYAVGLGPVVNPPPGGAPASASPLSTTTSLPSVTIGGVPAPVSFSGLASGFAGLYQVNVRVPDNAPAGDAVPVVLTIGNIASNTVTVAVQ